MRVVNEEAELINSIDMTQAEARVAFGDDTVYMEIPTTTSPCRSASTGR